MTSTNGAWTPQVAFVLEPPRSSLETSGLVPIVKALEEAGMQVRSHTLAGGSGGQEALQRQLRLEPPDLLCATGLYTLNWLVKLGARLGVPVVLYDWPAGPVAPGPAVPAPSRALVSGPASRRALLRRLGDALPGERVHVLPPLLPMALLRDAGSRPGSVGAAASTSAVPVAVTPVPGSGQVQARSARSRPGSQSRPMLSYNPPPGSTPDATAPSSRTPAPPSSRTPAPPSSRTPAPPSSRTPIGAVPGAGPIEIVVGVFGALDDLERLPWIPGCRYDLRTPPERDSLYGPVEAYRGRLEGLDLVLLLESLDPAAAPELCAAALLLGLPVLCENEAPLQIQWPAHFPGVHRRVLEVVRTADLDGVIETYADPRRGYGPRQRLGEAARNYAGAALGDAALGRHVELIWEVLEERATSPYGKRVLRQMVASVAARVGAHRPPGLSPAIALAYHQVRPELRGWDPNLVVSASALDRQVRALKGLGYRAVTVADQAAQLLGDSKTRRREPTFSISFDDGYRDTLEVAGPLLRGLGVPFTVYLITDVLSGRMQVPWYDVAAQAVLCREARAHTLPVLQADGLLRPILHGMPLSPALARAVVGGMKTWTAARRQALIDELLAAAGPILYAASPRYLDLDGARRLRELGAELSSHTCSHPILTSLSDEELRDELGNSRTYLAEQLGACPGLAYPNGDHDARVETAAHAAGYQYAVAVTPQRGSPRRYALGRRMISELSSMGLSRTFDEPVFVARACGLLG